MQTAAPFLRWAGSKRQLVGRLASYWNGDFDRYVEPFAGSACLFFHVAPPKALLGDVNSELIATYREIKYRAKEVSTQLCGFRKNKKTYYAVRKQDPSTLTDTMQAVRFIYLNRCCFNGLFRTNLLGEFNVPYGGGASGAIPSPEILKACSKKLRRASLLAADFEATLDKVKPGDFVYMDPPFSVNAKRVFKEYSASIFNLPDVFRLRQRMERLADERIHFLVSYLESEEAKILSKGFRVTRVSVRRNISGFIRTRSLSREMLISYP
ncbi:MAG TPA: Dam family site-specific DNA-(adenine-N6)-methyltransferase [Candidatus Angelobacter sp.]|nr:Dam family site-specific DNA-(adenine-N6)-methyltransferase [Candidatus Angelobacter sp.]